MIVPCVTLGRTDVTNAAVAMIKVVPAHEAGRPGAGLIEIGKALGGKLGPILGGTKQRLGVGVVVTDARPGVRGFDAQPFEHRQYRRGLERGAVVAVQDWLGPHRSNTFGQRRAAHQMRGMVGVIDVMDFPAHDLAAVQVQDQIQLEPASHHLCRQVGHVPAPDLARFSRDMCGARPDGLGRLGPATMGSLPVRLQHTAEGGLAGHIDPFVGQHVHDARRWHRGKAWLVGYGQQVRTLGFAQGMGRWRAHGLRPAVNADEAIGGLPAMEGAHNWPGSEIGGGPR